MGNDIENIEGQTLAGFSIREMEMAVRHFEQIAEVNLHHFASLEKNAHNTKSIENVLTALEKKCIKLERKLSQQVEELEESRSTIKTLERSVRAKSRMIDSLESKLAASVEKASHQEKLFYGEQEKFRQKELQSLEEKRVYEHALLSERGDYQAAISEAHRAMRQGFDVREQWLRQAVYLLRMASDRLAARKVARFKRGGDRQAAENACAAYINQWCAQLGGELDGLAHADASGSRVNSLESLLTLKDRDFVRSAFLTLLHREPDEEGERYYLSRLRSGSAKIGLLCQMRRSAEGRVVDPGIAGLDRAIKRYRWGTLPVIGRFFRSILGTEGEGEMERRVRAYSNALAILQAPIADSKREPLPAHLY